MWHGSKKIQDRQKQMFPTAFISCSGDFTLNFHFRSSAQANLIDLFYSFWVMSAHEARKPAEPH